MHLKQISALSACVLVLGLSACGDKNVAETADAAVAASEAKVANMAPVAASEAVSASEAAGEVQQSGPVKAFTAFGSKPKGWRVVVRGEAEETGNRLALEGEDLPEAEIDATRSAYAKGVEFSGNVGETAVNLNIRTQECTDSEGNKYDSKATLDFGSTVYEGCAVDGAVEHAPT